MLEENEIFYGTSGPRSGNPIMIVGESWGQRESELKQPFVGTSGDELTRMLSEAGIRRDNCFMTNVVPARPPGNRMSEFFHQTTVAKKNGISSLRGLYPKEIILNGLEALQEQIKRVNPKAIIGFGNYTLWALTDDNFSIQNSTKDDPGKKVPGGITSWRGSQLYCAGSTIPFMPTYHPAAILRKWDWRYPTMHDLRQRFRKAINGSWGQPEYNFTVRPSYADVISRIEWIEQRANTEGTFKLSVDLETAFGHVGCIGLGWSSLEAICIPFWSKETRSAYWEPWQETEIVMRLRKLIGNRNIKIRGQNFLFDSQWFAYYWGVIPTTDVDTMTLQHLCWPGTPKGLDYISSLYCSYHRYWKDEGKEWHPSFSDEQEWTYNCKDCVVTYEAADALSSVVTHFKLNEQAKFQMEQFHLALDMMIRGVRIDENARQHFSQELGIAKHQLEEWLDWFIPESVYERPRTKSGKLKGARWFDSPKQAAFVLFDLLHLKAAKRSTDNDTLTECIPREPLLGKLMQNILDLRSVAKFKRDFVEARLSIDHRMRCSFNISGPKTFRWSSSEDAFGNGANLQTIPKGTED